MTVSADRLLAPVKKRYRLKARATPKPGTLLQHQIPIRTFSEWDEGRPGFVEVDLVSHDGGDPRGDFIQTLDLTDVCTGWTETQAVKHKAQVWVFEALKEIKERLPFELLGLDSDNGSEFINAHLLRFCRQHQISAAAPTARMTTVLWSRRTIRWCEERWGTADTIQKRSFWA